MASPLPVALRQRIVDASLSGEGSYDTLAKRFKVGRASVTRLLRRHRERGSLEPDAMGGARHERKISPEGEAFLRGLIEDESVWTRQELCDEYFDAFNVRVSVATMGRVLKRLGLSRKRGS